MGATPLRGSLDDLDVLRTGAESADGVLHMAFGGDFADPEPMTRRDRTAIEAIGRVLEGTGRPFVSTSGTLVMPAGRETTEQDAPDPDGVASFRIPGESVVRLAPTVHGPGDHGFIGMLVATARKTGVSAYVGDGTNRWPAVHRLDAATLFRLALEKASAGSALHGAAESVTLRGVAESIADALGLPAVPLSPVDAAGHFASPFMAMLYGMDAPVSASRTRALLDWSPVHPTLLEDLAHGDYFATPAAVS